MVNVGISIIISPSNAKMTAAYHSTQMMQLLKKITVWWICCFEPSTHLLVVYMVYGPSNSLKPRNFQSN